MSVTVDSVSQLNGAIKAAHPGDTILLAPGTYSGISLIGVNFTSNVTIASANPNSEAVISDLAIKSSSGLSFQNLELYADPAKTPYWSFTVTTSSNLTFNNLNVHGTMDNNALNDSQGLSITNSSNISVSNSEFQQLHIAISEMGNNNISISGNYIHDITTDGIENGGSSNVLIDRNYITNISVYGTQHPDAIQFWTTGTTASAHDITVSDNIITRGNGTAEQGIFIQDELGNLPYNHVTVDNNLLEGTIYNGITVRHGTDIAIANNQIVSLPDQISWVRVDNSTDVALSHNQASSFNFTTDTGVTETADTVSVVPADGGAAAIQAWLTDHLDALPPLVESNLGGAAASLAGAAAAALNNIDATKLEVVTINGSDNSDALQVNVAHDSVLNGGAGSDTLTGGGVGDNILSGGAGDDLYVVKSAFDVVVEDINGGNDTVSLGVNINYVLPDNVENLRLSTGVTIGAGNALNNQISGSDDGDTLSGAAGNDTVQGGAGNDLVDGSDGDDILHGRAGSDTVIGGSGNDQLYGDDGNDSLGGGAGNDTLDGGAGGDTLSGGAGADVFIFRPGQLGDGAGNLDVITDFSHAQGDKIALTLVDANSLTTAMNKFAYIGTTAFHHKPGELHFEVHNGDGYVMADTNGDGVADFTIILKGVTTLQASDFLI